jgi:hypothetical protein
MRFRARALSFAASVALASVVATGAVARPVVEDAYFASDNIELIANVPLDLSSGGAKLVGDRFYVTTSTGLTIFDVSDPEAPEELGSLDLPMLPRSFATEDVDTNGEVLLLPTRSSVPGDLYVIDVRDPRSPEVVKHLPGAGEHTMSCVLDCTYAFGDGGSIVDLDPMQDAHVVGSWDEGTRMDGVQSHDVTEIRPGVVLTASEPAFLIDVRKKVSSARLRAVGPMPEGVYVHGAMWPRQGRDRFVLIGTENEGPPRCGELERGELMVFDATHWVTHGAWDLKGVYRVNGGTFTDGRAPLNTACGHWFDPHPDFKNGGLVAMAWYEHGVRFLSVASTGKIEEVGYFVPVDGSTSAAYWVTDDLVYATDYNGRGIDILRVKS